MKKKEIDLRDRTVEELAGLGVEKKIELSRLKFRHSMGQMEKTADLKKARREIARINTIIREKELAKVNNAKQTN